MSPMDVRKTIPLPLDSVTSRGADPTAIPGPPATGRAGATAPGLGADDAAALLMDQLHIAPLDLVGALQIVLAEARAGLPPAGVGSSTGADVGPGAGHGALDGPGVVTGPGMSVDARVTTPQAVIQLFLQALPQAEHQPASFLEAARSIEADLSRALDDAITAVTAWRAVPPAVVDGVRDARIVVLAALTDDPPNPLWLRPEWLGLAPSMERFWRRRRWARRALADPDLRSVWHDAADSDVERPESTHGSTRS